MVRMRVRVRVRVACSSWAGDRVQNAPIGYLFKACHNDGIASNLNTHMEHECETPRARSTVLTLPWKWSQAFVSGAGWVHRHWSGTW